MRKIRGGAAAISVLVTFAFVASAQATITTSNVTTPADGAMLVQNRDANPTQTFTVSGTTNGISGDRFDIDCYNGNTATARYEGPGNSGIALTSADFSVTSVPQSDFAGDSCLLLAVPHGTTPSLGSGYTGPRVGFSEFTTSGYKTSDGALYDYYFDDATPEANNGSDSIDDCGPFAYLVDGTTSMNKSPYLINCGGNFYNSPNALDTSADLGRSEIQIDAQNAYGSDSADNLFAGSDALPGFPALTVSLDSFDISTGNAQTTESEPLVTCTPDDSYAATSSTCSAFASTGVSLKRVTSYSNSGRVATVTDTYSSTDGEAHSLDLEYETDLQNSTSGWQLPGQPSPTTPSNGATGAAPSTAPGTVYGIYDVGSTPSLSNPVGALTFATPYNSVTFYNTLWTGENSALFDYQRMVPAGGSTSIMWSYATGTSQAEVDGYAADAVAALQPVVTITSPANGATVTSSPVTVTGTAGGGSGVQSVAINGVTAAVSGGHWTATLPLTQGPNTLTATMTTTDGSTATASATVTYVTSVTSVPSVPSANGQLPDVTLVSKRFNGKAVLVKLTCAVSGSNCAGKVTLRYTETVVKHHKKHKITLVLAGKNYAIGSGHTATTTGTLMAGGKRLLKAHGKLATKGTVTVTQANGHTTTGATFKLMLKQASKRK